MFHQYIAFILINTRVNRFFFMVSLLVQVFQVLLLLVDCENIRFLTNIFLLDFFNRIALCGFMLALSIVSLSVFGLGWWIYHRQKEKIFQTKKLSLEIVTKIFNYTIILFQTTFLIPLCYQTITSFKTYQSSAQLLVSSILLISYLLFILPVSLLRYWNKFSIFSSFLSYPFFINLVSLIHLYLHIVTLCFVINKSYLPFINLIFSIFVLVVIFYQSPFSYEKNRVVSTFYSLIVASILVSALNKVFSSKNLQTEELILYFLSTLCTSYLIYFFQEFSIKRMYLKNVRTSKNCLDFISNHNEMFLYHMLNYSSYSNHVFIYLFQHQSNCINDKCLGKMIFRNLREDNSKERVFSQIKQFFIDQIKIEYHPSQLEGFGQKQIQKALHEKGKLYLLISQLMLIGNQQCTVKENLRKTYCFLKQHEELTKKSQTENIFITRVQISAMLQIIQQELIMTVKKQAIKDNFSSKAQEYFEFQQNMQTFKTNINKACDSNIEFWQELMYREPDYLKVKKLISKSHHYVRKVEKLFEKLTFQYKRSSIVIYELMAQYSELVLNCEITSIFNPFHSLHAKYREEMTEYQKEKHDTINASFSVTAKTPVCMISLEKNDSGSLCWQNTSFREEYHLSHQIKSHINDLMLPFFREKHMTFLTDFSIEDTLRYDHGQTFIYKETDDGTKIFEVSRLYVQILPSVKMGLKLLIHFKNQQNKKEPKRMILIDEHFEQSLLSKQLYEEWESSIVSTGAEDEFMESLQNKFKSSSEWLELVCSDKVNNVEIKLDMQDSDYKAKLVKTIKDVKGNRFFCFEVFNMLTLAETSQKTNTNKFEQTLKSNPQVETCFKDFLQNTALSINELRRLNSKDEKIKKNAQTIQDQFYLTADVKKVTQVKSDDDLQLQKIYKTISSSQTPRKVVTWRVFTTLMIVLIMGTMIANMVITSQRTQIYQKDIDMIKNYNQLIQYIARTIITLRQYNYQAFKNATSPIIPSYRTQLLAYQQKLLYLIHKLNDQLTSTWMAFEFVESGQFYMSDQNQYVVIANYLLSSITYLSERPATELSFPFLQQEFFWFFGMTKTQSNFMNAIWNGMYVCLFNMLEKRKNLTSTIQHQILDIPNQLYVFPASIGVFILFLFIGISLCIQSKSCKLISQTSKLLETVTQKSKKQKIYLITEFKNQLIHEKLKKKIDSTKQKSSIQDTTNFKETVNFDLIKQNNQLKPTNRSQFAFESIEKGYPSSQTDRQLTSTGLNEKSPQKQTQLKKSEQTIDPDEKKQFYTHLSVQNKKFQTISFYLGVVAPYFAYFIAVFCGGLYLNNKIMFYINFGSEMYSIQSHQQYNYLYARQTFIFQGGFDPSWPWGQILLPGMMSVYPTQHFVEDNFLEIDQKSSFAQLKNIIDHANLCEYLHLIPKNQLYYGIDFSRSECESIANQILTKGLKSSFIYFTETGIQLVNRNMWPQFMQRDLRIKYLQGQDLRNMKRVLAYCEQFYLVLNLAYQDTINSNVEFYTKVVSIFSLILICSLILITRAINYRWKKMKKESKQAQSIVRLISLKSIREKKKISDEFLALDYNFYQ